MGEPTAPLDGGERRRLDTRVTRLEEKHEALALRMALSEQKTHQLQMTVDSRHDALESGQQEILNRLNGFIPGPTLMDWKHGLDAIEHRVNQHDAFLNKLAGGFDMVKVLGIISIISGIVGIFTMLKGH